MNILLSAYSVRPNSGSEPGMGWNWIKNVAIYCNVFVITEGEWKDEIEIALEKLPQRCNIFFFYNSVTKNIRKMCWNQGDWRFYYFYNKWQRKTFSIALDIISENHIDVLHQLNMIGFREPGYLWKIKGVPFVWGPIGGMEAFPERYLIGESMSQKMFIKLKNRINNLQVKYSHRVSNALDRADALIAATNGVKEKIERYHHKQITLINETGCYINNKVEIPIQFAKNFFDVIWVGKFDFRKQLGLALKTISKVKNLKGLRFHIVGSGSPREITYYRNLAELLDIQNICKWHGSISNSGVQQQMKNSDLLFFTSIMEGTPHAVLEAIGNNLPILCFNTCGQADAVNSSIGIKIEISSSSQSVNDFAESMVFLYKNKDILNDMSKACNKRQEELCWDNKVREMMVIYEKVKNNSRY